MDQMDGLAILRGWPVCEVRVGYRLGQPLTLLGGAAALAGWLFRRGGARCSSAVVLAGGRGARASFGRAAAALGRGLHRHTSASDWGGGGCCAMLAQPAGLCRLSS